MGTTNTQFKTIFLQHISLRTCPILHFHSDFLQNGLLTWGSASHIHNPIITFNVFFQNFNYLMTMTVSRLCCYQVRGWLMDVEYLVEWEFMGETKILGGNLSQCHFVHNKTHMTWPGIKFWQQRWESQWLMMKKCRFQEAFLNKSLHENDDNW
jgi:hypothetical protein